MPAQKTKTTFVLVIPRFEDIFHSFYAGEIIRGVSLSASRLNSDFLIHITDRSNHAGWLDSSLLDPHVIDGIIFADIDNDIQVVHAAIQRGVRCMVLNNILEEPINYVAVDNYKAGFGVTEYLIKQGHTQIATIAGDVSTQAGHKRLEGFRAALLKHQIHVPQSYLTFGEFLRTPARLAAQRLLRLRNRPTAVFAASDVMALELMDVAKSMAIQIPEELSVVGFDDNPLNLTSSIELTTVEQPLVEMGRQGAEYLSRMCADKAQWPVKVILPTKLIERQSVRDLRNKEQGNA